MKIGPVTVKVDIGALDYVDESENFLRCLSSLFRKLERVTAEYQAKEVSKGIVLLYECGAVIELLLSTENKKVSIEKIYPPFQC